MFILGLYMDKDRFYKPTSFLPERWLPEAIKNPSSPFYNDDRAAVQPFSVGPRSCIGRPLALAEARTILAKLVWAFDIEEVDTKAGRRAWEEEKTYSIIEKQPFEIKLKIRKQ
jgi:cytochrome P450